MFTKRFRFKFNCLFKRRTLMVWCMAYTRGVDGGACIAKWACNSMARG